MLRLKTPNYRIHGRLNCDPTVRNGQRQDEIQNSFWQYEIECTRGKKKKDKKGIRLRNRWHHNRLLMLDCTAVRNQDTPICVFCSYHPVCCWAGPNTGCEGSEPERSTAGPYCIDWSLKLGCLILGALFLTPGVQTDCASKYLQLDLWSSEDMLLSLVVFPELLSLCQVPLTLFSPACCLFIVKFFLPTIKSANSPPNFIGYKTYLKCTQWSRIFWNSIIETSFHYGALSTLL